MSEEEQGITTSDDIERTKYMKTIPTKKPKVPVEKFKQRQREIKIGSRR